MRSWDELIAERMAIIPMIAHKLNVSQNYLTYQTDFLKAVTLGNRFLAEKALLDAKKRLEELK